MGEQEDAQDRDGQGAACVVAWAAVADMLRQMLRRRRMPEGLRVEDLVQDSLAAVWRAVDERRLVDPAEALPYALGVAHHRWVDAMRKAGRRPGVKEWTDDGDLRESEEWDPGLAREELAASLQGLLRKSDIQLFLALRWDGLKLAEAAAGLGWSAGQAEAGRRRIQRFLSDPVLVGR